MSMEDMKNILAVTASVSTILQFLSGILVCQKIVKKRSTGDTSALPFISGCLSTLMWLEYGILIQDDSLILVNSVGATLFSIYTLVFLIFTSQKTVVLRQFFLCSIIVILSILYCQYETDISSEIKYVGLVCCCVTLMFFAAPLASLYHVLAVKSAESLPFPIILSTFIVCIQWFFYGVALGDLFIQIPNIAGCVLSGFQLSLFYIFRTKYAPLESI